MRVVATTTDLAALVAVVGGDLVTVESIVPAGVDPEAFEPRPGDLAKVRQAALLVRVGLGYDYWLDATRQPDRRQAVDARRRGLSSTRRPASRCSKYAARASSTKAAMRTASPTRTTGSIPRTRSSSPRASPKPWSASRPAQRDRDPRAIVNDFWPSSRRGARAGAQTLAPFAGARLIAYHNSWPYFARRFRLDVIAFIEPKAGRCAEPGPSRRN